MHVRFLHCADIHLGGRFAGLSQRSEDAAEAFAGAAEQALDAMARLAVEEQVDFVLVAGDLYDGQWTDLGVGFAAARAFGRLHQAGIPSFLVKGNHDAESVVTNAARLPESVHVFASGAPETVRLDTLGVAIHGWSFPDRAAPDNMALRYPAAETGLVNIGVLHTSLDGREGHDRYAPCSLDDLARSGYDYWALGHVHEREIVRNGAAEGAPWVVFPGSLQGRSPREPGPRGAMLVDIVDGRVTEARFRACDVARFAQEEIDLDGLEEPDAIERRAREALALALDAAEGRPMAARLRFTGATALDAGLRAESRRALLQRMNDLALHVSEQLFVEKAVIETRPPRDGVSTIVDPEFEAILDAVAGDETTAEAMLAELESLFGRAPMTLDIERDPAVWLARARAALAAETV